MESHLNLLKQNNSSTQLLIDVSASYLLMWTCRSLRTTKRFNHQLADISFARALLNSDRASTREQRFRIQCYYVPKLLEVTLLRRMSSKWVPFVTFALLFANRNRDLLFKDNK
jgi:hypothetical protein